MQRIYKYVLILFSLAFLGYHSIYFEKLSEARSKEEGELDFDAYADTLYHEGMLKNDLSVEISSLLTAIKTDKEKAFDQYGNRLGIGSSAYFMVEARGTITDITADGIGLITEEVGKISINTKYIFGNALRDASGLVKLTDFKTNAEFNQLSEALNTLIRTKIIPPIKQKLKEGQTIQVIGAIRLSKKNEGNRPLVITPMQITPL